METVEKCPEEPRDELVGAGRKPAYVHARDSSGEIDLFEMGGTLWASKWLIVAVALVSGGLGAAYGWLATPWYRSEVLLIAAENRADQGLMGQLGQLGGLASLAGLSIGATDKVEPLAVLKSREFAELFIEQQDLMTVLFADLWDANTKQWRTRPDRTPDLRDGIYFFDRKIRRVVEDRKTGLVTLAVEWKDPTLAANWANEMAREINRKTRERALATATTNIAYLQSELQATRLVTLQDAIGRLLESEMQKLMIAQANEEFAFRVLDRGQVPKRSFKPRKLIASLGASVVGFLAAMFFVLARESYRRRPR